MYMARIISGRPPNPGLSSLSSSLARREGREGKGRGPRTGEGTGEVRREVERRGADWLPPAEVSKQALYRAVDLDVISPSGSVDRARGP